MNSQDETPNSKCVERPGASKTFCRAAFGSLHVSIGGDCKPCCVFESSFGNLKNQSIEDIWFSEGWRLLRAKMLRGERDARCWQCDEKADAGAHSLRDMFDEKTFIGDEHYWSNNPSEMGSPKVLDVRFSNLCNLSCRTCWPGASTKWYSDAKQLGLWDCGPQALNETFSSTKAAIEKLSATLETIDEIYFAGGEPLLHEGHYAVLNELIRLRRTNVRLIYNTNLTSLNLGESQVVPLWSHFKEVFVGPSIDGHGKQGELIRQGLSWTQFTENVSILRKECPHVDIRFAITVSVLNVLSLSDLCEHLRSIDPTAKTQFSFNIVQDPSYYRIQILPMKLKLKAKRRLERYGAKHALSEEFRSIISFMMFEDRSSELPTFRAHTLQVDQLRSQRTAGIIPELACLLREPGDSRVMNSARAIVEFVRAVRNSIVLRFEN